MEANPYPKKQKSDHHKSRVTSLCTNPRSGRRTPEEPSTPVAGVVAWYPMQMLTIRLVKGASAEDWGRTTHSGTVYGSNEDEHPPQPQKYLRGASPPSVMVTDWSWLHRMLRRWGYDDVGCDGKNISHG